MKIILSFISGVLLISLMAFIPIKINDERGMALVEKEQGVYIYYRSKPVTEYEYLGTYKVTYIWKGDPMPLLEKLVKKIKEDYPDVEAVIVSPDMYKGDAIKFK
jgi:hypothetical protein